MDSNFGGDGNVNLAPTGGGNQGVIQPDGKIIVVGVEDVPSGRVAVVYRLLPGGGLDTNFGAQGKVTFDSADQYDDVFVQWKDAVAALQPDGKIVVGVTTFEDGASAVIVYRLLANGSPDIGFGSNGAHQWRGSGHRAVRALMVDGGRITVVGRSTTMTAAFVFRLNQDGTPDYTFGNGTGEVLLDLGGDEVANAVTVTPNRSIYVVGSTSVNNDAFVYRLLPSGAPDLGFSGDGVVELNNYGGETGSDIALQPDGWLDGSFGTGGAMRGGLGDGSSTKDEGNALALQQDGKILVAGRSWNKVMHTRASVWRLESDGSPDQTFGPLGGLGGYTVPVVGSTSDALRYASDIAVQPDQNVVLVGLPTRYGTQDLLEGVGAARIIPPS